MSKLNSLCFVRTGFNGIPTRARHFSLVWLNSNKGTKSDIEIAPAKRFEAVVQIGSSRVVATGDKLLAGAISQQALDRTIGAAPASSRQRLGDVVATYLRRHLWDSVGIKPQNWLLESGR